MADERNEILDDHLRRQAEGVAHLMPMESAEEARRKQLLDDIARIDSENRAKLNAEIEAKRLADEKASAAARAAELRDEAKTLREQAKAADAEAARLEKLAKE